jgi:Na+-transporting NADH:ubiquinone oxidoreductase subunit NqrB
MKIRRALLKSGMLAAAAAMAGGALWVGETPAQDATSLQTLDASSASSTASAIQIQRAWNTSNVSVSGIVSGTPESVSFSGTAKVGTRLAPDPDFGSPNLVLSIDLTGVSGVGSSTRMKYAIGGPEIVQKRLAASHLVEITFPFYKSGTDGTTGARSGAASFTIDVDMATGAVTNATGNIGSSPL